MCSHMKQSVCVCRSQLLRSLCACVCLHVCVCGQQPGGLGCPVKVMCADYLESGRGRLAHCSVLVFYVAALSSLIIFYTAAITDCLEKKGPPATAHGASSKTRQAQARAEPCNVLARNTAADRSAEYFYSKQTE